jgi:hypothetical protein
MTTSPSRTKNPLLSAALGYAERGWRVFPLWPGDKRPIPEEGFKAASSDHHQVLEWWQLFPDANIGLATGNPFDVLDLDNFSVEVQTALLALLGSDYHHEGPVALTGKGAHYYFAASTARNRAKLFGVAVDFRGDGGYVVAPPSLHPSGRLYRWAKGRDDRQPLPKVPEALEQALLKPTAKPTEGGIAKDMPDGERVALLAGAQHALGRPDILMVANAIGCQLYTMGQHYVTNCIFHDDPGPSMVLYTGQNKFYCYGCEAHGDSKDLANKRDMTGKPALFI